MYRVLFHNPHLNQSYRIFLYIILHMLSMIMSRRALHTPILLDDLDTNGKCANHFPILVSNYCLTVWAEIHKYYDECDWSKKWAEGLQEILT